MLERALLGKYLVTDKSLVNWLLIGLSVLFGCSTGNPALSETLVDDFFASLIGSFF